MFVCFFRLGDIFSSSFTEGMKGAARELGLSERIQGLLNTIHEESICPDFNTMLDRKQQEKLAKHNNSAMTSETSKAKEKREKDMKNESQIEGQKDMDLSETDSKKVPPGNMGNKTNSENSQQNIGSEQQCNRSTVLLEQTGSKSDTDLCLKDSDKIDKLKDSEQSNCGMKRPHTEVSTEGSNVVKKLKVEPNPERRSATSACPLLFYNVNRRKIKGVNIPK